MVAFPVVVPGTIIVGIAPVATLILPFPRWSLTGLVLLHVLQTLINLQPSDLSWNTNPLLDPIKLAKTINNRDLCYLLLQSTSTTCFSTRITRAQSQGTFSQTFSLALQLDQGQTLLVDKRRCLLIRSWCIFVQPLWVTEPTILSCCLSDVAALYNQLNKTKVSLKHNQVIIDHIDKLVNWI